jgi:hypothetical protein
MTEMFSAFKSEFNKVYETETELLQRYEMFTKNVNIINNHNENEAASAGYTMAINQFTDWTTQEFSAYLTYNGTAKKHDRIVLLDETDLATSVDWTTKGAVTPVSPSQPPVDNTSFLTACFPLGEEPSTMWLMLGILHHWLC